MKIPTPILAAFALFACAPFARAQALPAGTEGAQVTASPTVPSLNRAPEPDAFHITLGAAESLLWGYNGVNGLTSTTSFNGTAAYISGSESHPTSLLYSGGYLWANTDAQISGSYQNFGISQQINKKRFALTFGDTVNYLPNAPVFGLSGIPGVGDVGTSPIGNGGIPTDSILSDYGRRISNSANGGVTIRFTAATAFNTYAAYTFQRFIDNTGIDNTELDAGGSVNHRFSALNAIGVGYSYSHFTYDPNLRLGFILTDLTIDSTQVNAQYQHVFSRKLTFNASAGPQWMTSSDSSYVPDSMGLAANVSLQYVDPRTQYLAAYTEGTSTGGGVLIGTWSENVNFTVDHSVTREFTVSASVNYGHARSLAKILNATTDTNSFYAGAQATRRFGRFWSAYLSYNIEHQTLSGPFLAFNAFSGNANVLGFGVNYSPRPWHTHR
jgi:hypothetical protein